VPKNELVHTRVAITNTKQHAALVTPGKHMLIWCRRDSWYLKHEHYSNL